jgi:dihydroceramide fatty acyl 2-hydroxylase
MEIRRSDVLRSSPRMFESDLLDKLSRVHPVVPPVLFIPAIAVLFALGQEGRGPFEVAGILLAGYLFWTLTEYWLHRLVFHFEPDTGWGHRLHWIIHGVHHDHPNDPLRLVMPPSVSVPLALAFYGLFVLVLPPEVAQLFAAGFLAGYLAYDMTHYHVHHHRPRSRVGKLLRELHMRHHFQDETRGFGVSAPFWDYVFGTPSQRSTRS